MVVRSVFTSRSCGTDESAEVHERQRGGFDRRPFQCDEIRPEILMSLHPTIFADTESGPEVWIRVEGRGSFQNSPALKEFSRKLIDEGRRKFVVDLKSCLAMDSTFMGTLAGLAIRLRDTGA